MHEADKIPFMYFFFNPLNKYYVMQMYLLDNWKWAIFSATL